MSQCRSCQSPHAEHEMSVRTRVINMYACVLYNILCKEIKWPILLQTGMEHDRHDMQSWSYIANNSLPNHKSILMLYVRVLFRGENNMFYSVYMFFFFSFISQGDSHVKFV